VVEEVVQEVEAEVLGASAILQLVNQVVVVKVKSLNYN